MHHLLYALLRLYVSAGRTTTDDVWDCYTRDGVNECVAEVRPCGASMPDGCRVVVHPTTVVEFEDVR